MQPIRLTNTSYIVLGLLELCDEATPYELKQFVSTTVGNFWSVQHAQLYTEPERLTSAGLLTEEREQGGRRRRRYALTGAGRRALKEWRSVPTAAFTELRDPGLLQLFFGADPRALAEVQLAEHRAKLAEYEAHYEQAREALRGPRLTLEAGIAHEREWVSFWKRVAEAEE